MSEKRKRGGGGGGGGGTDPKMYKMISTKNE